MLQMILPPQKILAFVVLPLFLIPKPSLAQNKISLDQYIEMWWQVAVEEMHLYGIPASIKLAQGILESGFGNSLLATKANNHFGIKCHGWPGATFKKDDDAPGECFRAYKNAAESFRDHSLFLTSRPRYSSLFTLDITDYKGWARGLRQAGYATNPRYPELLIRIIDEHDLSRFDKITPEAIALNIPSQKTPATKKPSSDAAPKTGSSPTSSTREIFPVPLEGPRQELVNNRIRYVRARPGDTAESITKELGLRSWQISKYNELTDGREIKPGQIIYLQPKRRRAAFPEHVVRPGETMYDISQIYGVKLNHLYRRNNMDEGSEPYPGQVIILRGKIRD
jgi:LysM repeat protein